MKRFIKRLLRKAAQYVLHDQVSYLQDIKSEAQRANLQLGHLVTVARAQMLGPDRITTFWWNGTIPVKFYVPKAGTDYIQGYHLSFGRFWEQDLLDALRTFARDKMILDIGANIGNHAVYWSRVAGARSVVAVEPIPELYQILERNVQVNDLLNVRTLPIALGRRRGTGVAKSSSENRMQSEILPGFAGGDLIEVWPLDALDVGEIDFAKIDVEGHTLDLLLGARHTLERCRPAILVELFPHERDSCMAVFLDMGYRLLKSAKDDNYLLVHQDRDFAHEMNLDDIQ